VRVTWCLIFPGRDDNAYSEINVKYARTEGTRTHLVDISFQCARSGERDGGLLYVEEDVLDVSVPHGPIVSLGNWALQQPLDGIGNLYDGRSS